jgi:hypothetical protein
MGFPEVPEDDSHILDRNPDPPQPLPESEQAKGPLVLELDRKWLHERVAEMAFNSMRYDLKREIDNQITAVAFTVVQDAAKGVACEPIENEVRRIIEEGWQQTDEYGRAVGKRTLSSFVLNLFIAPMNDGYSSDKSTYVQKIAKKIVDEFVQKDLAAEMTKVREALKAQVDGIIAGKFVESLRSAVGLSR